MSRKLDIHILYSTEWSVLALECVQEHRNLSVLSAPVGLHVVQFYLRHPGNRIRTITTSERNRHAIRSREGPAG